MTTNRYRNEDRPFSYDHSFHAGNTADVWKHVALIELTKSIQKTSPSVDIIDCHAGRGVYDLAATGEWIEGIGAFYQIPRTELAGSLKEYLELVEKAGFVNQRRMYPGSPVISSSLLRDMDSLTCFEIEPEAARQLEASTRGRKGVRIIAGDGLGGLDSLLQQCGSKVLILIDPPWTAKSDWTRMPEVLFHIRNVRPDAVVLLWYPIKSYTRVSAMQKVLRIRELPFTSIDLITTPLEYKRRRLNGSGLLLLNADARVITNLAAHGTVIGRSCAVTEGWWEVKVTEVGKHPTT